MTPAEIPVTVPLLETDATDGLLLVHVPFVEGVTLTETLVHTELLPPTDGFPGMEFITALEEFPDVQVLLDVYKRQH